MAFGKQKKQQQNWALKRLKIYHAYKRIDLQKIYYHEESTGQVIPITGLMLKEELERKYKWLVKEKLD